VPEDLDAAAEAFTAVRPRLFGIAYRMLGSVTEAEDVVQDAWLRWQRYDRATVEHPAAFLATTTTRLAVNAAQSARARREEYVGQWLPEPVDTTADPALGAERAEALELAVLLLLERLTPTERAAYVLREAFAYPYREIAAVLGVTEPNARQLATRARGHVLAGRPRSVGGGDQRRLVTAFVAAARAGDLAGLEEVLAEDVVTWSDGGGLAKAARVPVRGRTAVAKFYAAFAGHFWAGVEVRDAEVNGRPGAVLTRAGEPYGVIAPTVGPGGVVHVLWQLNPGKLAGVA
jgi:RNA polymerase sigma-70 factor (TIGR02957 family)